MNLEHLLVLKSKLLAADDFKEPWDYFFDNFGVNPDFLQQCTQTTNAMLKDVVLAIGKKLFKQEIVIDEFSLLGVEKYNFFHGACIIRSRIATLIYFKDIDIGLFTICLSSVDPEISLVRFSCIKIGSSKDAFLAPFGSKVVN